MNIRNRLVETWRSLPIFIAAAYGIGALVLSEPNPLNWKDEIHSRSIRNNLAEYQKTMGLYNLVFQLADKDGLPGIGQKEANDVWRRATGKSYFGAGAPPIFNLSKSQLMEAVESYRNEMKPEEKKELEGIMQI
ncbi:MAG: hypothetical protein CMH64_03940 [Nanoarchaeota archaeon]|nr:hypothetical protein [Nanoarchaeota archaeon]|tara:strand:- start:94 stop:495 length:402 start_codon:yes stop_codon:yes gene_type:complete